MHLSRSLFLLRDVSEGTERLFQPVFKIKACKIFTVPEQGEDSLKKNYQCSNGASD